jgi:hypothetical protein
MEPKRRIAKLGGFGPSLRVPPAIEPPQPVISFETPNRTRIFLFMDNYYYRCDSVEMETNMRWGALGEVNGVDYGPLRISLFEIEEEGMRRFQEWFHEGGTKDLRIEEVDPTGVVLTQSTYDQCRLTSYSIPMDVGLHLDINFNYFTQI